MLSTALQCGIPSLRRTISDYGLRTKSKATDMVIHRRSESSDNLLCPVSSAQVEMSTEFKNKLSVHGFNLLQASIAESHGTNPNSHAFSRQLYLDSIAYLLQGLPSDLSRQETLHLQAAAPLEIQAAATVNPSIANPALSETPLFNMSNPTSGNGMGGMSPTSSAEAAAAAAKGRSILHRGLAAAVVAACVIFRLFLPYIRFCISTAYRVERQYHVSEKVFATTMSATDSLGRKAIEVASTALGSEVVVGGLGYCIDGVCGGLTEGLGEGFKAFEGGEGVVHA